MILCNRVESLKWKVTSVILIPGVQFSAGFGQHKRQTLSLTERVGLFRLTNAVLTNTQILVLLCKGPND